MKLRNTIAFIANKYRLDAVLLKSVISLFPNLLTI